MSRAARPTRLLLVLVCACLPLAMATAVRAHDPPVCFDVRWRADTRSSHLPAAGGSDNEAVCMSNRGPVFLDPATRTWRMACSRALGIPSTEIPDFVYAPDGRLLVATSSGLVSNADGGCTWTHDPAFAGDNTTALAQDPTDPSHLLLTTGGRMDQPDGVHASTDGGDTWNAVSTIARDEFYEDLLIAPSNPRRLYAAATAFGTPGPTLTRFLARSDDGGATWTRLDQQLGPDEAGLRALAVHPSDPDTVLVLVLASDRTRADRLRLSTDAGATFSDVLTAPRMTDAAFGADGTTAWASALSGLGDPGLWRSSDGARTFEPLEGPYAMGCAFERAGTLHACGRWSADSPFGGIARSRDGGKTFETWMLFHEICDPVACGPASETAGACADLWLDWQYEIHGCTGVYGGEARSDAASAPTNATQVCGCPDPRPGPPRDAGNDAIGPTGLRPDAGGRRPTSPVTAGCGCRSGAGRYARGGTASCLLLILLVATRIAYIRLPV